MQGRCLLNVLEDCSAPSKPSSLCHYLDEEASPLEKDQPRRVLPPIVNCEKKEVTDGVGDILSQVSQTHDVIMALDKTISTLEVQLATARASKSGNYEGSPVVIRPGKEPLKERQKLFFVMGIMTAFSSRKRRESIMTAFNLFNKTLNCNPNPPPPYFSFRLASISQSQLPRSQASMSPSRTSSTSNRCWTSFTWGACLPETKTHRTHL